MHNPKFKEQPRLAYARIRHRRDNLPMARCCAISSSLHRLNLAFAAHELGQTAAGRPLQARPQLPETRHLIQVDWFADAFDFGWTQRLDLEISLDEFPRLLTDGDRPCGCEGLYP